MVSEWPTSTVGEVSTKVTKGTTPTTIGGRFVETGVAFVKVESITDDGRIDQTKLAFIDDETNRLLARSVLEEGDVLFTIAGTIGRVARVPRQLLPANTNQAVAIVRPDPNVIDPRFLYYVLRDDVRVMHAHTRVVQSVQANFSLAELSSVEIPLPPKDKQHAIAHILGTLDDKIELNRRMNETLEAMARVLFKSWFVDFDPVRAKMEGRWKRGQSLPGLPAHLYDLFPDRLVPSELGEIPEGWEVGTLKDFAALNPETWSKKTRPQEIRYVDLSNTKRGRIESVAVYSKGDAPSRAQRVLRPRDTIIGTVRPGNGSYAFILEEGLTGSTGFAVLRPRDVAYAEFVYLAATAFNNIEALAHMADGGAYPAIRPD
ncbi:MAG TPA: restriction endonuclease subunit S, partial [Chloroflexi bacterium]|nr:restriction endonuclease subunit S [Chloroflexota bacterium]